MSLISNCSFEMCTHVGVSLFAYVERENFTINFHLLITINRKVTVIIFFQMGARCIKFMESLVKFSCFMRW